MNNLEDITRIDYISSGTDSSVLHAEFDEETGKYLYIRGEYVREFSPDFVVKESTFLALRGEEVVEFVVLDTIDNVEKKGDEVVVSDEELARRINSLKEGVPPLEMWWDFLNSYDDWSFVQFVRRNRPHLI